MEAAIATASPPVSGTVPPPASPVPEETDLTRREREVLALLVEGLADRAIAERLSISPRTASKHVLAILEKLGVESRTAAATLAIRGRLV
jgi:DNA-binding NarL/FixJ family response regulator